MSDAYCRNPNLKKINVPVEFTEEQIKEFTNVKTTHYILYLNYVQIVSLDEGLVPFNLYDFQEKMVQTMHNERFTICKLPRQSGKSTTIVSYLLHYALFNPNCNIVF